MNEAMMRNATDEELLRMLSAARGRSPVIADLCRRLERLIDEQSSVPTIYTDTEDCPVCLASLKVTVDTESNITCLSPI